MSFLQEQIEMLFECIVEAVHPLRIILFGSAARHETSQNSDIDLLVVMPDGTHRRHTAQDLCHAISGVKIPFDIIVATPGVLEKHKANPGLIYKEILEEGKLIYAA